MTEAVEEIWVSVTEGAEKTGYSSFHIRKLARDNWSKSEKDRAFQLRRLSHGYIIWLPDLVRFLEEHGNGPQPRKKPESLTSTTPL
jgi:hypothetical protein